MVRENLYESLENEPFEHVFPIQNGDIPLLLLVYQRVAHLGDFGSSLRPQNLNFLCCRLQKCYVHPFKEITSRVFFKMSQHP